MAEKTYSDIGFDAEIAAGVCLVDFWAEWCGPCRAQGPVVEKLAQRYQGKASVGKLNVDRNQATAKRFGVSGIPTLILFKDGKEAKRFVGLQSEAALAAALDAALI
jgi:thioredoxin 1